MPRYLSESAHRARALRRASTPAERLLWEYLRDRRLEGVKFRRQAPVGPFYVDFYSRELGLAIEVDGAHHSTASQAEYDRSRDRWLRAMGIAVLRLSNHEVLDPTGRAIERIRRAIAESR